MNASSVFFKAGKNIVILIKPIQGELVRGVAMVRVQPVAQNGELIGSPILVSPRKLKKIF